MTEIGEGEVLRRLRESGVAAEWRGAPPAAFAGLRDDSRELGEGELFVAVTGTRQDGHDFLSDAARRGAAAAVVERPDPDVDLPQLVVDDSRAAVAHLAALFQGDPGRDLDLVGVTGTNGKTTTAWLTRYVLSASRPTGSLGTLGVTDPGGETRAGDLTTPGPIRLNGALRELRQEGAEAAVLELSSHALDQGRAEALELEAGVFTTLSREHLEYHRDMEDYRRAKLRLAELVRPAGVCVVNADEAAWRDAGFAGRRVVRYGFAADADVRVEGLDPSPRATRFRLVEPASGGAVPVRLGLLGEYNVGNAAAAAAVGLEFGLSLEAVAERLSAAPQVPGRLERLRDRSPVVVRDYAHTPAAMEQAVEAVRGVARGRLLLVFGAGGERDRGKRPLMGDVAARLSDRAWVTNDNPRGEDPERIAADVAREMPEEAREIVLDREEAIRRALEEASPADIVLLLGKGHETHMVLDGERIPFDEAEVVARLSRELGLPGEAGGESVGSGAGGEEGRTS